MCTPKTILARMLFVIYVAMIALLCFIHVDKLPEVQRQLFGFESDKLVHFVMFLPFPILAYLAYDHHTNKVWRAAAFALISFVLGALLAMGTEYVQGYLPYRSRDLADLKADIYALAISAIFVFIVDATHLKRRKN